MSSPIELSEPLVQDIDIPYPPCIFRSADEKRLYLRLRDIYLQHSHTWDQESKDAWPDVIEHASLSPSTVKKVTSHIITKSLTPATVTWAHVVVLRVIFKTLLVKSKKTMKVIMDKYPRASFHTYAFSEDYKLPLGGGDVVAEGGGCAQACKKKSLWEDEDDDVDDDEDGVKPKLEDLGQHVDGDDVDQAFTHLKKRKERKEELEKAPSNVKHEAREDSPTDGFLNMPEHPSNSTTAPPKKRKHPSSTAAGEKARKTRPDDQAPSKARKTPAQIPSSSSSQAKTKARTKNKDNQPPPPIKLEAAEGTPSRGVVVVPAKRGGRPPPRSSKDSSKAAAAAMATTPGTRIENPLRSIEKRLAGQDGAIRELERLLGAQAEKIRAQHRRIRELEEVMQHLQPWGKKTRKGDVMESIEKAA